MARETCCNDDSVILRVNINDKVMIFSRGIRAGVGVMRDRVQMRKEMCN
eukprot:CAMPEP_0184499948 /NCGR_PEP_ID=MMETSP0113_2-20130426/43057_1 /TAXON_ID=91329 /ORGANISM="Norrisiella sphaerica, Strain BC52" /LENGTH=48 /DNA_ID= /DNA_START= /DNA_END= /DNA_ORIENTATION=